jgi:hypothetical protein
MVNLLPRGITYPSSSSFPFILACFFSVSFRFFFSHEQQKLEDIGGGIFMHVYAVDIIIDDDEPTFYPLIGRGTQGDRDVITGLPNSTDLSHSHAPTKASGYMDKVAIVSMEEGITARAGSLIGDCTALLRMYLE